MYPSPEEETFLRAKIEVVHKSLLHLCAVAPITCSYIFEGVVHLVMATIEICEQVFEKPQLVELLSLHKITERQSCAERNSNETFAPGEPEARITTIAITATAAAIHQ
jgi:hypothetical protein